jgi:hypothetical protein
MSTTHRQIARKKARAWQVGAVALLAGAGALAAFPIHSMLVPKAKPIDTTPPDAPATETLAPVDAAQLAAAANTLKLATKWKPPETPMDPPADTEGPDVATGPTPPVAPVATGEWFYIGSIITPRSKRAMVRIDEDQHMMTVGDAVSDTKVVAIEPEAITVERNGQRRDIALQTRLSQVPTDGPRRPVAFRAGPNPMASAIPGMPNPGKRPQMPQTFDQTKQAAPAEAARRAQLPVPPPAVAPMPTLTQPMNQEGVRKALADEGLPASERQRYLEQMGVTPGMSTERAMNVLQSSGIQMNDSLVQALKINQDMQAPGDLGRNGLSDEEIDGRVVETMLTAEERNKFPELSRDEQRRIIEDRRKQYIQQHSGSK